MNGNEVIHLCDMDDCTGCMACVASCRQDAIILEKDRDGFKYPVINHDKCIGCLQCQKSCQVISGIRKHKLGEVYAAWSLNEEIRMNSSSGGLFSELAISIIKSGGCVVGASLDNTTGYVNHIIINNVDDLKKLRGSKYVQSYVSPQLYHEIKLILKKQIPLLFSGCPCQVVGLYKYLKHNYSNLYTIDIVCHGVPSPEYFARIFKMVACKYDNLISYNFRDYENWGACSSVNIYVEHNKHKKKIPLNGKITHYQDAYLKGYLNRKSCYHCNYSEVERVGDITLADFWGIGKYKLISGDYKHGCSMVSINTDKGNALFGSIKEQLHSEKRDIHETINGGNEQLIRPSLKPIERDTYYEDFYLNGMSYVIKKYKLSLRRKSVWKIIKALLWKREKK